eukprot:TRINITY_DN66043_c14_g7_i1.p1 TRINITY_DN66043_c14_g7~~TRINITY_DN66043_c14_g7_i1.p1  ORF type:complete len:664 (-),score=326.25 TRINITY_DN66043_c14_g7_i1:69-1997(-)
MKTQQPSVGRSAAEAAGRPGGAAGAAERDRRISLDFTSQESQQSQPPQQQPDRQQQQPTAATMAQARLMRQHYYSSLGVVQRRAEDQQRLRRFHDILLVQQPIDLWQLRRCVLADQHGVMTDRIRHLAWLVCAEVLPLVRHTWSFVIHQRIEQFQTLRSAHGVLGDAKALQSPVLSPAKFASHPRALALETERRSAASSSSASSPSVSSRGGARSGSSSNGSSRAPSPTSVDSSESIPIATSSSASSSPSPSPIKVSKVNNSKNRTNDSTASDQSSDDAAPHAASAAAASVENNNGGEAESELARRQRRSKARANLVARARRRRLLQQQQLNHQHASARQSPNERQEQPREQQQQQQREQQQHDQQQQQQQTPPTQRKQHDQQNQPFSLSSLTSIVASASSEDLATAKQTKHDDNAEVDPVTQRVRAAVQWTKRAESLVDLLCFHQHISASAVSAGSVAGSALSLPIPGDAVLDGRYEQEKQTSTWFTALMCCSVFPDDSEAFWMLLMIVRARRTRFPTEEKRVAYLCRHLSLRLRKADRELWQHLNRAGVDWHRFASRWFRTYFADLRVDPIPLWDRMVAVSEDFVVLVAVNMLTSLRRALLRSKGPDHARRTIDNFLTDRLVASRFTTWIKRASEQFVKK